jgi:hypothetical protein
MSDSNYEQMLAARFRSLSRDVADHDWAEVLVRSARLSAPRPTRSRRMRPGRLVLVAAIVTVTSVVAVPALGLPQQVVKLFTSGEPAPKRTETLFSTLDRGAPPGLETRVIPGTARKAFDTALPEGPTATLWVAPTAVGGFCMLIQLAGADGGSQGGAGPGCVTRDTGTGFGMTIPGPVTRRGVAEGPLVVSGHVTSDEAVAALIRFEDETVVKVPLTWISPPIDAGFFVLGVPPANWQVGHLPREARFVDSDGDTVGRPHEFGLVEVMQAQGAGG